MSLPKHSIIVLPPVHVLVDQRPTIVSNKIVLPRLRLAKHAYLASEGWLSTSLLPSPSFRTTAQASWWRQWSSLSSSPFWSTSCTASVESCYILSNDYVEGNCRTGRATGPSALIDVPEKFPEELSEVTSTTHAPSRDCRQVDKDSLKRLFVTSSFWRLAKHLGTKCFYNPWHWVLEQLNIPVKSR